jgi:hypothetical protein
MMKSLSSPSPWQPFVVVAAVAMTFLLVVASSDEHNNKATTASCDARNIHISLASSSSSSSTDDDDAALDMGISFTLEYPECENVTPTIVYAVVDNNNNTNDTSTTTTTTTTTTTSNIKEKIQFDHYEHVWLKHSSSYIYHAVLEKLRFDSHYWYQIQSTTVDDDNDYSHDDRFIIDFDDIDHDFHNRQRKVLSFQQQQRKRNHYYYFTTPPAPGTPTTLAFVGDWGQTANSIRTMKTILRHTKKTKTSSSLSDVESSKESKDNKEYITSTKRRSLRKRHKNRGIETSSSSSQQQQQQQQPPVSGVVVVGDIAYANGHLPSWESWLTAVEPLFATVPLFVVPGNHEIECDAYTYRIFQPYENYFRTPEYYQRPPTHIQPVPISQRMKLCTHPAQETWSVYEHGNSYYEFQYGLANVIVLNSYTDPTRGSVQYNWLQDQLEKVNRSITPWSIVTFHSPFHTTFHGHNSKSAHTITICWACSSFFSIAVNLMCLLKKSIYSFLLPPCQITMLYR